MDNKLFYKKAFFILLKIFLIVFALFFLTVYITGILFPGSPGGWYSPAAGMAIIFPLYVAPIIFIFLSLFFSLKTEKGLRLKFFVFFIAIPLMVTAMYFICDWASYQYYNFKRHSISTCKKESSQDLKNKCYLTKAFINNDSDICQYTSNSDECYHDYYFNVSRNGKDSYSICGESPKPDDCYFEIAQFNYKNKLNLNLDDIERFNTICNLITDKAIKNNCLDLIKR